MDGRLMDEPNGRGYVIKPLYPASGAPRDMGRCIVIREGVGMSPEGGEPFNIQCYGPASEMRCRQWIRREEERHMTDEQRQRWGYDYPGGAEARRRELTRADLERAVVQRELRELLAFDREANAALLAQAVYA